MNYSNLSEIEDLVYSLPRQPVFSDDFTLAQGAFQPIIIDSFEIYLCASEYNNCSPRDFFDSLRLYDTVQVHIHEKILKEDQITIITPSIDERFKFFEWKKYFSYEDSGNRTHPSYIGSRVPLKTIFQIVKDINKLTHLRTFF